MPKDVLKIILEMIQDCPKPIKTIAEEIGKPYSTLMREIDPGDKGAKLGADMLLPLMRVCNSIAPVSHMAEAMGYRVVSNKDITPDKATFHEELLDTYQALVDYHRTMLEGQPVEIVAKRREVLIRQLKEDYVFFMNRRLEQAV